MEKTPLPEVAEIIPLKPSYSDIEHIVEHLVKSKSYSYAFDCWSAEDIGQEIRIICMKALEKYDPLKVKSKLENYFGRCVDNGLKNLKRNNYVRTSSPHKKRFLDLSSFDDSEEAQKIRLLWDKFQKNIKIKLGVIHAKPLPLIGDVVNRSFEDNQTEYKDLEDFLISSIQPSLVEPFIKMLSGDGKEVEKKYKRKIQLFVKRFFERSEGTIAPQNDSADV